MIGPVAVKLNLPEHMRCHNVFHVSQVKLYRIREGEEPGYPTPMLSFDTDGVPIWQLEKIVQHRPVSVRRNQIKFEYKVKWVGLPEVEDEYILEDEFVDGGHAIRENWRSRGLEPPSR